MKFEPKDSDFQIDRYRLDDEWVKQPDLYRRYAEVLANAKRDYDEVKNQLSVTRAEVELAIRKDPSEYDLDKVTEGVIKAVVETVEAVIDAESIVVNARFNVNMIEAAVGSLDHRKRALSDLVSLHLSDYYSKPVAREGDREATDEMGKKQARRSQRRRKDDDD
jgi:hypothetical protein